jgi:hypothetical protein
MRPSFILAVLVTCCGAAWAQTTKSPGHDKSELDALSLADDAKAPQETAEAMWRIYVEGAGNVRTFAGTGSAHALRGSIDARLDTRLASGLRVVLSNRLDLINDRADQPVENVNTLREAFISWSPAESRTMDVGRVNVRHGAAFGYNPTDWFKENALRGIVSPDPTVLRENRLGTVVLRGQQLWPSGALTLTLSPKLKSGRSADPETFSLDLASTNSRNRWLLAGSWRVTDNLAPEVLLFGGEGSSPQLGFNLSTLAGDSVVLFGEAALGQGPTLAATAGLAPLKNVRQQRAAFGLTYTTPWNLSVTMEAEYNSAAPSLAQWRSWQAAHPAAGLALLGASSSAQDLPVRHAFFTYLTWKDALVRRVDVSAFVRHEFMTNSRSQWIEIRHRWDRADVALQILQNAGKTDSLYRALPLRRAVEASVRWYL